MPAGIGTIGFVDGEVVAATCWTEVLAAFRGLKQVQEVQYRESHLEAVGYSAHHHGSSCGPLQRGSSISFANGYRRCQERWRGYCGYDLRASSWQEAFTMAANGVVISR